MRLYLSSFRLGNKPEELLKLLNGKRRAALILNAVDYLDAAAREENLAQELARLDKLGLDFTEIDLRNYFGKADKLKTDLALYDLIWVRGGNSFLLRRALKQSGLDTFLPEMLKSNQLAYAGYSAGIDMLTPHLHGIELVDDPHQLSEGYDPAVIWECLGLLPYCIAPHYQSDHPESAAVDKTVEYYIENHIPFIALKDGQAIVVNGDQQRVIG